MIPTPTIGQTFWISQSEFVIECFIEFSSSILVEEWHPKRKTPRMVRLGGLSGRAAWKRLDDSMCKNWKVSANPIAMAVRVLSEDKKILVHVSRHHGPSQRWSTIHKARKYKKRR